MTYHLRMTFLWWFESHYYWKLDEYHFYITQHLICLFSNLHPMSNKNVVIWVVHANTVLKQLVLKRKPASEAQRPSSPMRATLFSLRVCRDAKDQKGAQVRVSLPKALAKASFIYCLPKSQILNPKPFLSLFPFENSTRNFWTS